MDSLIGQLVASGAATLNELKTVYSLEDAFLMWEAVIVPKYNEYAAIEAVKRKHR